MKNLFPVLIIWIGVTQGFAQKVTYDYDHTIDFSGYVTFSFLGWQDESDKYINDLDMARFKKAFGVEFGKRRMRHLPEGGDVAISLYVMIDEKSGTSGYSNRSGVAGRGYSYPAWGWGGGYSTTTYGENDYVSGTIVMDIFDGKSKLLVWQGVVTKPIEGDPQKRDKTIPETIALLMENFPPK